MTIQIKDKEDCNACEYEDKPEYHPFNHMVLKHEQNKVFIPKIWEIESEKVKNACLRIILSNKCLKCDLEE